MTDKLQNPYVVCPSFTTGHFLLRLIREDDARDLLQCYADPAAAPLFNSDNCTSSFIYHSLEEMQACVRCWVDSYRWGNFVRFSIVDQAIQQAVGTIEFFARPEQFAQYGRVGVLRLDLASRYETELSLGEILQVVAEQFYDLFGIDSIVTKAAPQAKARLSVLRQDGYVEMKSEPFQSYGDYYVRIRR